MPREQALALSLILFAGLYFWWQKHKGVQDGSEKSSTSSILATYTRDLTKHAETLDPVVGREEEIDRVVHILSRRSKNNPLLLGEPGVGKTAIVEGIARAIATGNAPKAIAQKRVLALDLGALIGGTKYRGEFESRMKQLTEEVTEAGRKIILFIDEFHMVEQAKGAEGAINVSDILKPALARGDLQMIGASTWAEYEEFIKPDRALDRRLQPVIIGEPSEEASEHILNSIKGVYEKHHSVRYAPAALKAAVHLSKTYIQERFLPDKAIDLIDEAGAKVSIEASHHTRHALGLLHAAGQDTAHRLDRQKQEQAEIRQELVHLKRLEADVEEESELKDIRTRMERLVQARENILNSPRSSAEIPEVTVEDIRSIVADWIGKPTQTIQ